MVRFLQAIGVSAAALVVALLALKLVLPGWLVMVFAGIAVIVFALSVVSAVGAGTPRWILASSILGFLLYRSMIHVQETNSWLWDAWMDRLTLGSFKTTDLLRPDEALALRREIYAAKTKRLAEREKAALEKLRGSIGTAAEKDAENELREIEQGRRMVQMLGKYAEAQNTSATKGTSARGESLLQMFPTGDDVFGPNGRLNGWKNGVPPADVGRSAAPLGTPSEVIPLGYGAGAETYDLSLKKGESVQVSVRPGRDFKTSLAAGCEVEYIFPDGRRFRDAFGEMHEVPAGRGIKNSLFRVRNVGAEVCNLHIDV